MGDNHTHDHRHEGEVAKEHSHPGAWESNAVLDIGGDIGALILHTGSEYLEREIEVSPLGDDAARTHTAIHERLVNGAPAFAGIYAALPAGEYRVWTDDPDLPDRVTIVGGEVAELDWRREP
ncbi:MAG: phospholipase [Acidimicrobiales bacterium]